MILQIQLWCTHKEWVGHKKGYWVVGYGSTGVWVKRLKGNFFKYFLSVKEIDEVSQM